VETSISECSSSDASEAAKLIADERGCAGVITAEDGSDAVIVVSISLIWSSRLCALDVRFKCMERSLLWFPGDNIQWLIASAGVGDKNLAKSGEGN
jgi:hypothetical protein